MSEEFELELSSFSNRINVFCLLIWRCLNVKSSLSRTDGSEGKVYKKVTVANLALCEKNGRSNPALGGALQCSITISNCKHDTFIIPVIITEVGSLINNYIRESR